MQLALQNKTFEISWYLYGTLYGIRAVAIAHTHLELLAIYKQKYCESWPRTLTYACNPSTLGG